MRKLIARITALRHRAASTLGDWALNVSTSGTMFHQERVGKYGDAVHYEPWSHWGVLRLISLLAPSESDVCVDIGCGKGRVVCYLARQRVRRVIGIDISEELCNVARRNAAKLRGRRSLIQIVHADAALADVSQGTIFIMHNPFGPNTMRDVLTNIERTRCLSVSPVSIAYVNALHADVFDEFAWLERVGEYRGLERLLQYGRGEGCPVVIWRNRLFRGPCRPTCP